MKKSETIRAFWRWFKVHAGDLKQLPQFKTELYPLVIEAIRKVDKGLVCDFEIDEKAKRYRLIISSEGKVSLFPLVMRVVGEAEVVALEGWEIAAFRSARKGHFALQFPDYRISSDNVVCRFTDSTAGKVEVELYIKDWQEDLPGAAEGVRVLMDNALGEYVAHTQVSGVIPHGWDEQDLGDGWIPLIRLRDSLEQKRGKN
jgi:hypothetical protein